jgi:hypothetical protein
MFAAIALVGGVGASLSDSWWGPALFAFALFEIREAYLKRLAGNWQSLSDLCRHWQSRRSSRKESPGGSAASPTVARRGVYLLIGAPLLFVGAFALSHGILYGAGMAALCGALLIWCAVRGTTF